MSRTTLFVTLAILLWSACRRDEAPLVANTAPTPYQPSLPSWFNDSIGSVPQPPNNPWTVEGVALGRKLFYEPALSDNYTMSCATCHVQEHGFSDPLALSVGTDGSVGTRNAMATFNLAWDHFFFWDGRRASLEEQAHDPVTNNIEMRNTWPVVVQRLQADPLYPPLFRAAFGTDIIDSNLVTKAISQFERSLLSFNSRFDRFRYGGDSSALSPAEIRGKDLFFRDAHCVDCHVDPLIGDGLLRNNGVGYTLSDMGLADITGNPAHRGKFKVTSLRNIASTAPYMHDSRFATLAQVVDFYAQDVDVSDPDIDAHMQPWLAGQIDLDAQERADLVAFMLSLTDSTFLTNSAFGAP